MGTTAQRAWWSPDLRDSLLLTPLKSGTSLTTRMRRRIPTSRSLIGTDPGRKQATLNMSEMWATFAKTGQPAAKGQPSWPAYTLQKPATMMIDTQCKVEEDPFGQELALWDGLSL